MEAHENFRKLTQAEAELRKLVDANQATVDADYKRSLVEAEATVHAFAKIHDQYRKLFAIGDDEDGPDSTGSGRALQSTSVHDIDNDDWVPPDYLGSGFGVDTLSVGCTFCDWMDDDDDCYRWQNC